MNPCFPTLSNCLLEMLMEYHDYEDGDSLLHVAGKDPCGTNVSLLNEIIDDTQSDKPVQSVQIAMGVWFDWRMAD